MSKSGLADNPLFHTPRLERPDAAAPLSPAPDVPVPIPGAEVSSPKVDESPREPTRPITKTKTMKVTRKGTKPPEQHDTTPPRHHDSMVARYHATTVERIRSAVKRFGKEAATHRFTLAEKKDLANMVYTYKLGGIRTSENEMTRIAVNFIVADYEENGENSLLNKVLKALHE